MPAKNGHRTLDASEIAELKAKVDLAQVVRDSGVSLKRVGQNLVARCPFHDDAEASLVVNSERQLWNCFGCQTGGDVFTFLELKDGLSFPQAIERLQGAAPRRLYRRVTGNGSPKHETADEQPLPGGHSRGELLGRVVELYAARLRESRPAQTYLTSRGLGSAEVRDAFRIGFADGSLLPTVPETGELRDALVRIGVLNARGKEHFAGCVVVPLEHPEHGVVGLYGRKIAADPVPHLYLPGPQRGVLNWQALKRSPQIVLAESVLDAISLWASGCRNATCLFGVHGLPPDLDVLLGRFAVREVTFCLDGDRAGREATERLAGQLGERGIRCLRIDLPEAMDPNQVIVEQGAPALHALLERAQSVEGEAASPSDGMHVEPTDDGFLLRAADVVYHVAPRAPFSGRLRVLLRASRGAGSYLDTLDLFAHRARAAAVNQLTRRLELMREEAERHLLAIVEHAERWVTAKMSEAAEEASPMARKAPEMSSAERDEALAFLRRPDLVEALLEDMEALGYVGEERGKLLAYLIGISRKLDRPLSGIVLSQSGAGKSCLTELVEVLTPPEEVELYSRISAQALGYMQKDFLKRKLVILEERAGGEAADYQIRTLQSRQKLTQAVVVKDPMTGKMHTRLFEVEGPIAYLETTTNPHLNHENATRCFELGLDESEEQTRRIHARQRTSRSLQGLQQRSESEVIRQRHHNAQRLLEPVRVLIPYVEHLSFPSRWLRTRRDNERFLCLIEAVTFLHQHQRPGGSLPSTGGEACYVEATAADYRLAYDLAREVLGTTLHELTRGAQDLWEAARQLVGERSAGGNVHEVSFTRRELRSFTGWPDRRLREALQELVDMEYVGALAGSQGRTYQYQLLSHGGGTPSPLGALTTPDELEGMLKG